MIILLKILFRLLYSTSEFNYIAFLAGHCHRCVNLELFLPSNPPMIPLFTDVQVKLYSVNYCFFPPACGETLRRKIKLNYIYFDHRYIKIIGLDLVSLLGGKLKKQVPSWRGRKSNIKIELTVVNLAVLAILEKNVLKIFFRGQKVSFILMIFQFLFTYCKVYMFCVSKSLRKLWSL